MNGIVQELTMAPESKQKMEVLQENGGIHRKQQRYTFPSMF